MEHNLILSGKNYTVQPLPAKRGLRLFVRVGRLLGPAYGQLGGIQANALSTGNPNVSAEQLERLFTAAFQNLDQPGLEDTVEELMATVSEDGVALTTRWTAVFAGRLKDLYTVLRFAVEAHFGDFLTGSDALAASTAPTATGPNSATKRSL